MMVPTLVGCLFRAADAIDAYEIKIGVVDVKKCPSDVASYLVSLTYTVTYSLSNRSGVTCVFIFIVWLA